MPTEMLLHWAKCELEDDPVLLVDTTVLSSYANPTMT